MTTDRRTRQTYPPDGTVVAALFYGSAHWHTGPIRWEADMGMHRLVSDEQVPGFLEEAAHWYEVGGGGLTP